MTQTDNPTPRKPSTFIVALAMAAILLFGMLMFLAGQANANTAGLTSEDAPALVCTEGVLIESPSGSPLCVHAYDAEVLCPAGMVNSVGLWCAQPGQPSRFGELACRPGDAPPAGRKCSAVAFPTLR